MNQVKFEYPENHHTAVLSELMTSPEFLALSKSARLQYFYIKSFYRGDGGKVRVSYSQLNACGFSDGTIRKNFKELMKGKFIALYEPSHLVDYPAQISSFQAWQNTKKQVYSITVYRLTFLYDKYGRASLNPRSKRGRGRRRR